MRVGIWTKQQAAGRAAATDDDKIHTQPALTTKTHTHAASPLPSTISRPAAHTEKMLAFLRLRAACLLLVLLVASLLLTSSAFVVPLPSPGSSASSSRRAAGAAAGRIVEQRQQQRWQQLDSRLAVSIGAMVAVWMTPPAWASQTPPSPHPPISSSLNQSLHTGAPVLLVGHGAVGQEKQRVGRDRGA